MKTVSVEVSRQQAKAKLAVVGAYVAFGVLPAFWKLLVHVKAEQVLFQRILWSAVGLLLYFLASGKLTDLFRSLRTGRTLKLCVISALLLGINWFTYIWAIQQGRLSEASLGYYLCPVMSIVLGALFLRESLGTVERIGVSLLMLGIISRALMLGAFPWIAVVVASSFSLYSFVKKQSQLSAAGGLMFETLFLLPVAFILAGGGTQDSLGLLLGESLQTTLLFILSGAVTTLPLVLLIAGAKNVPLQFVGLAQYAAPSCSLLLAVLVYGEPFKMVDLISFGFIWAGVAVFMAAKRIRLYFLSEKHALCELLVAPVAAASREL